MRDSKPPAKKILGTYVPVAVYEAMKARSKQHERSVSAELRLAIRMWLEQDVSG